MQYPAEQFSARLNNVRCITPAGSLPAFGSLTHLIMRLWVIISMGCLPDF
jgi:hypothetical protein